MLSAVSKPDNPGFLCLTSLNRYSGITSGFDAFIYAIVTENVAGNRDMKNLMEIIEFEKVIN